jgi:hypothetical protein
MGGTCSAHGNDDKCVQNLGRKSERKKPLGRWEDNIRVDLWELGWKGVDRIDIVRDRDERGMSCLAE